MSGFSNPAARTKYQRDKSRVPVPITDEERRALTWLQFVNPSLHPNLPPRIVKIAKEPLWKKLKHLSDNEIAAAVKLYRAGNPPPSNS